MSSTKITSLTTVQTIYQGSPALLVIKNTSAVTCTISTETSPVADEGHPLAPGASLVLDLRVGGVTGISLYAIANSGTGSLSILAIG